MPKIDAGDAPTVRGSRYPSPFDQPCQSRTSLRLGAAGGLTQFGVNLVTMPPGCWSSQRHWHSKEDEFVWVLEGETLLKPGDCAAFKGGVENGHHLVNRSGSEARFLVVGTCDDEDYGVYPD